MRDASTCDTTGTPVVAELRGDLLVPLAGLTELGPFPAAEATLRPVVPNPGKVFCVGAAVTSMHGLQRAERPIRPGSGSQPVVHPHRRLDVDRVVMLDAALDGYERAGHRDRARFVERQACPGTPFV